MMRDDATTRQVNAANPRNSTWLSANAGSGKTRVLTDRVARLLLEEVNPQHILCLTYTKAAAAEMQNRLFKRLGAWAMMKDAALRKDLQELGFDRSISVDELRRARTLFAQAIETPGGLKIQTIHAFCAGVLRRFPLEAAVSPQFHEMEDRDASLLRIEVMDALADGPEAGIVQNMFRHFTGADIGDLTIEIAQNKTLFQDPASRSQINEALGLTKEAVREDALKIAFSGGEEDLVKDICDAFQSQSATYQKFAAELKALSYYTPNWPALDTLFKLFLYAKDGTSKSVNFPQSNHKKAVEAGAPFINELHGWMDRVADARLHLLACDAAERGQALAAFGAAFVPAYQARKTAMGMLDFDDLIQKTKALLTDRRVAQWVLFRLDGGIDHVLVDEAQDTSPDQWAVIKQLTQEFTAGEGADPNRERTIFVVGDKKQSIYSFQGADPDAFDEMRSHFETGLDAVGDALHGEALQHSFRSSQAILRVVDETFTGDRAAGLEPNVQHVSFKANMPGRVDLWPVIEKTETEPETDWTTPVDKVSDDHHTVRLANQIAREIKRMIAQETLPDEIGNTGTFNRRPITEGDILILVQRRSDLFAEIIRACKDTKLQIAGADRLRVGSILAVKDLTALLSFLALPEDDLSLAATLKSPLFGWSEQDLFTLAHHRPEKGHLWTALRNHPDHSATQDVLYDLNERADYLRPYDLIERILTRHGGRHRLLARLGEEADDGIDALLAQALAYESTSVPSLTGFLAWMAADDLEIKRQMDSQGDKIRVMTVHGAKGLEAPIVILPDTAKRAIDVKQNIFAANGVPLWKTKANDMPAAMSAIRDGLAAKQAEERMRLLYVAMTRAEKWLIVAAAGDVTDSWYTTVSDGMTHAGDAVVTTDLGEVRRVSHLDWHSGDITARKEPGQTVTAAPVFGPTPAISRSKTMSPSEFEGAKALPGDADSLDSDAAMARGTAIHLLLEHLPQIPASDRAKVGATLLQSLSDTPDLNLVNHVIELLAHPDLATLFSPEAMTEVDVTAALPLLDDKRIHGTIDRLIVTDTKVRAIDYKTNQRVPDRPEDVPLGILRQMGAYHDALRQVFPDHQIETAILWTETAALMDLPADLITDALATVTAT